MKNARKKIEVGQRQPLVKNLLLIEGISRAGKFLLANLLNSIKGIEPVQYRAILEHIPRLQRFDFIDKRTAQELLRTEIDLNCYEMLIGRNLNHRKSDKSSIFNNPHYKNYLKRLKQKDGSIILPDFYKNNLYSLFIVHETLPNIQLFLDTFPKIKIISMQRSPIDLVYSWYKRKIGQRIGTDPLLGEIPLKGTKGNIPWYLYNCEKEYNSLSEIDKIILSIIMLFKMYEQIRNKKILFIRYENILSSPWQIVKLIAKFLKKGITPEIKQIIKKEKLPNKNYMESKKGKIKEIKNLSSEKYFKKLLALEKKYNKN